MRKSKQIKRRLYFDGDKIDKIALRVEVDRDTTVTYLFAAYDNGDEAAGLLYDDGDGIHVKTDKIDAHLDYSEICELKVLLDCVEVASELLVRKPLPKPYRRFKP